jgi:hypothetical protein
MTSDNEAMKPLSCHSNKTDIDSWKLHVTEIPHIPDDGWTQTLKSPEGEKWKQIPTSELTNNVAASEHPNIVHDPFFSVKKANSDSIFMFPPYNDKIDSWKLIERSPILACSSIQNLHDLASWKDMPSNESATISEYSDIGVHSHSGLTSKSFFAPCRISIDNLVLSPAADNIMMNIDAPESNILGQNIGLSRNERSRSPPAIWNARISDDHYCSTAVPCHGTSRCTIDGLRSHASETLFTPINDANSLHVCPRESEHTVHSVLNVKRCAVFVLPKATTPHSSVVTDSTQLTAIQQLPPVVNYPDQRSPANPDTILKNHPPTHPEAPPPTQPEATAAAEAWRRPPTRWGLADWPHSDGGARERRREQNRLSQRRSRERRHRRDGPPTACADWAAAAAAAAGSEPPMLSGWAAALVLGRGAEVGAPSPGSARAL